MDANAIPPAPLRIEPTTWEHYDLWLRVQEAIRAVPEMKATRIRGVSVSDWLKFLDLHAANR